MAYFYKVTGNVCFHCRELMHGDELHTLAEREAKRFKEEQDREDAERRKQMKEGNAKDFQKIIEEADVVKPVPVV